MNNVIIKMIEQVTLKYIKLPTLKSLKNQIKNYVVIEGQIYSSIINYIDQKFKPYRYLQEIWVP
jgi:hypothetical protein